MRAAFVKCLAAALALATPAAAEDCVMDAWERILAPGFQEHELKEWIGTPAGPVAVLEFGPLAGEHPKLWLFLLDGETCFRRAVVAGSYEATTRFARESGQIGPDERIWHFDLYTGDSHETLGMRAAAPSFEEARAVALEALARPRP